MEKYCVYVFFFSLLLSPTCLKAVSTTERLIIKVGEIVCVDGYSCQELIMNQETFGNINNDSVMGYFHVRDYQIYFISQDGYEKNVFLYLPDFVTKNGVKIKSPKMKPKPILSIPAYEFGVFCIKGAFSFFQGSNDFNQIVINEYNDNGYILERVRILRRTDNIIKIKLLFSYNKKKYSSRISILIPQNVDCIPIEP